MNFIFEISILNSFILWLNILGTAKPTKHYSLNDFSLDIAQCLIGGFLSPKKLRNVQPHSPSVSRAGISRHANVKLGGKKRGDADGAVLNVKDMKLYLIVIFAISTCVEVPVFKCTTFTISYLMISCTCLRFT